MTCTQADAGHAFDTRVRGKHGLLDFDVITTDEASALKPAKRYPEGSEESNATVTLNECRISHSEPL